MKQKRNITYREKAFVIESVSPLHIGSGEPAGVSDSGVVRDFNGLPSIPGTSLQGLLRASFEEANGAAETEHIFGRVGKTGQKWAGDSPDAPRGGRLWVSWGAIHNQRNNPCTGLISLSARDDDPVLRDASRPMLRDHVRLNDRGVAAAPERGKFDEHVVSAGHRFTMKFRFATADGKDDPNDWKKLEAVLCDPDLRLGGKSRRGLGAFKILNLQAAQSSSCTDLYHGVIEPEGLWMFGGGSSEDADSAPVSGTRIHWSAPDRSKASKGSPEPVWIIPGSGIKGALWHRTKFHANRLAENFADRTEDPQRREKEAKVESWMTQLFGSIAGDSGTAGKVFIDDVFVPKTDRELAAVQSHVSINPFTGGAKDSALFTDQPLLPTAGKMTLRVQIKDRRNPVAGEARAALLSAITDLCEGRLSLGAHAGRGYGSFTGKAPLAAST